MSDERFVDPRLVKKESLFASLHQLNFDILQHINAIQGSVMATQSDVSGDNEHWLALRDIFDNNLKQIDEMPPEMADLVNKSQSYISSNNANAHCAQVLACGAQALTFWRILGEIPDDLLDVDEVSATTKSRFMEHLSMWHKFFYDDGQLH